MHSNRRWVIAIALVMVGASFLPVVASAAPRLGGFGGASALATITKGTSSNWAGYYAENTRHHTTGSVTMVSGTWVQPTVSCTGAGANAFTVFWVGIDGATSGTVEQDGSAAQCISGSVSYYLWWELYPLNSIQQISSITVNAGDTITGTVTWSSTTHFTMTVTDGTHSFSTSGNQAGVSRSSAECIVERPSGGGGLFPLAKFTTAKFSSCTATIGGVTAGIGTFAQVVRLNMVGTGVLAATSTLTSHKAFTDTWKRYS